MKVINVEDSVGTVLCHDLTQIIPGVIKDAKFRKGHIIKEEDIPVLLSMGKKHLYVYDLSDDMVHEDDAAIVLKDICISENLEYGEIKEGKIELTSKIKGYLTIDKEKLYKINMQDEIIIATIKEGNVDIGKKVAAMRVIPLAIKRDKLNAAKEIAGNDSIIKVLPYKIKTFGMVVTGSEVYNKIIEDKFSPVIENKLKSFDVTLKKKIYCDDNKQMIIDAISELRKDDVDLILCTGGMSVDPDDVTPAAIIESKAKIVTYGTPVLPGAMFLVGYFENETPILGVPGCAMYMANTVLDVALPRILAKVKWTKEEFAELGYGGLCQGCKVCYFPNCTFGK